MNAYDKTIAIISTLIKTFLSLCIVLAGFALCFFNIVNPLFYKNENALTLVSIVFVLFFVWAFWKICPADTKNWIKNWTKPQLTKGK